MHELMMLRELQHILNLQEGHNNYICHYWNYIQLRTCCIQRTGDTSVGILWCKYNREAGKTGSCKTHHLKFLCWSSVRVFVVAALQKVKMFVFCLLPPLNRMKHIYSHYRTAFCSVHSRIVCLGAAAHIGT